jgi:hypothetical protein
MFSAIFVYLFRDICIKDVKVNVFSDKNRLLTQTSKARSRPVLYFHKTKSSKSDFAT